LEEDPQSFDQAIDQITEILNGSNVYFGHGAPEAPSEALWLIAHCVGISPVQALDHLDEPYDAVAFAKALKIVEERIKTRTPLAYLLKEAWLMGHCFECDERSIIPRSFIAELISFSSRSITPRDEKIKSAN
jgi:ribosomal protein L3 glutamine methyltransferase